MIVALAVPIQRARRVRLIANTSAPSELHSQKGKRLLVKDWILKEGEDVARKEDGEGCVR